MKTQNRKFWLIWSPTGEQSPRYRHDSRIDARIECERLAREHPGKEFFVLGAELSCRVAAFECHVYADPDNGIPF